MAEDVRTLTFDQDGHLWVGTFIGLNRFLSHEQGFQLFTHDASLPSSLSNNSVKSIYIDKKGSLWCGTYYGGINFLDENDQRFTNFKTFNTPYSLSHNVISSFAEDEKENIWIGTESIRLNWMLHFIRSLVEAVVYVLNEPNIKRQIGIENLWSSINSVAWNVDLPTGHCMVIQRPPGRQNYAIACFDIVTGSGPFYRLPRIGLHSGIFGGRWSPLYPNRYISGQYHLFLFLKWPKVLRKS